LGIFGKRLEKQKKKEQKFFSPGCPGSFEKKNN